MPREVELILSNLHLQLLHHQPSLLPLVSQLKQYVSNTAVNARNSRGSSSGSNNPRRDEVKPRSVTPESRRLPNPQSLELSGKAAGAHGAGPDKFTQNIHNMGNTAANNWSTKITGNNENQLKSNNFANYASGYR